MIMEKRQQSKKGKWLTISIYIECEIYYLFK